MKKQKTKRYNKSSVPFHLKKSIKQSQGYHCACCGRKFQYFVLQIHHITPRRNGGGNEESNLVAVCNNCHTIIHHYLDKGLPHPPLTYGMSLLKPRK